MGFRCSSHGKAKYSGLQHKLFGSFEVARFWVASGDKLSSFKTLAETICHCLQSVIADKQYVYSSFTQA